MSLGKYNKSYDQYLIFRNYDPTASKLAILKRALIGSWCEPGFHRFWQVWNPGIGHLLYCLYRWLGGNRHRLIATMVVFGVCGFIHDLIVILIFRKPFIAFTVAFILFGVLTLVNRAIEPILDQDNWPRWLNLINNVGFLAVSIFIAVQVQMRMFS